jgi:hypothetical protein
MNEKLGLNMNQPLVIGEVQTGGDRRLVVDVKNGSIRLAVIVDSGRTVGQIFFSGRFAGQVIDLLADARKITLDRPLRPIRY